MRAHCVARFWGQAEVFLSKTSDGEMLAPSGHLPLQSPDLVTQPLVQLQSCSAGQFNKVASEVHQIAGPSNSWKAAAPSRFSDLGHNVGTSEDPSQGNNFKINQLSRFAGSSGQIPTFRNEYQKKIEGIMGNTVPMVGFREQVQHSVLETTHTLQRRRLAILLWLVLQAPDLTFR